MKQLFPSKLCKLLVLILSVALIAGLVGCSGGNEPTDEKILYIVSVDNLNVHKKADADSRVLGQLPLNLEIEVLEEKAAGETRWGRIDTVKLPDGEEVKDGWIDLQYVCLPGEEQVDETEPVAQKQEEPKTVPATMGTVTADKLTVRKGPDSKYESTGEFYYKGDRIEILETQTMEGTRWGRTNLGWVGMGYVRMDGTAVETEEGAPEIISNGNNGVLGYGVVNLGELNVRLGPGTEYDKVGEVKQGARYAYYQASVTTENWVRIESGWVSTDYFYLEGTTNEGAFTGTVTTDDLNIRTGPDTSFQSVGSYKKGDTVEILAQVGAWGYTEKGWAFISYIEPVAPTYTTGKCTVTRGLNIRQEPNADSEIVGALVEGTVVTILEVDGNWGRTVQGWINLNFVKYE